MAERCACVAGGHEELERMMRDSEREEEGGGERGGTVSLSTEAAVSGL